MAVVFRRHLCDDRQVAHAADGANRRADLVDVAKRLEHEEIDATVDERAGLLAKMLFRLVHARPSPRLDTNAERADRAGDIGVVARRMPRDLRPLDVDRAHLIAQTEGRQLDPVRAERIRLEDVGAGLRIGLVDLCHQVGLRQVQLVERSVHEDAARVQHRPHRAVADEHALVQLASKIR